jgi:cytochrome c553
MTTTRLYASTKHWLAAALFSVLSATALAAPFEDTMAQRTLACTGCHGAQGRAATDGYYPRLAGKPAGYLYNQLLNFRKGRRHYGLMTQLLAPLSDAYLMDIAQYFSHLDVPYPAPAPSKQDDSTLAHGKQLVLTGDASRQVPSCIHCHGAAMTGVAPNVPGLLGLPHDYLNAQLGAWKAGKRRAHAPDCMQSVVARLSNDDINAISSYLAAQALPANTKPVSSVTLMATGQTAVNCGNAVQP